MSEDSTEIKGAPDSLQSFQSMNDGETPLDQENNQKSDKQKSVSLYLIFWVIQIVF